MKYSMLALFFLVSILIPSYLPAKTYTLDDLYGFALQKNEKVMIAEEELVISELEKDRALAVLFPTLSAFGSHTRYTDDKRSSTFILQPEYTNRWGLRLDQSFSLSGRELTAFDIAKKGIEKVGYDLESVREEILLSVSYSFYNVLKFKKALEITLSNLERLTRHRDAAKRRLDIGDAVRTDLLRAEAELAGVSSDLIESENALRLARAVLAKETGLSGEFELLETSGLDLSVPADQMIGRMFMLEKCPATVLDCLKDKALSERSEIKNMLVQKGIAEDEVLYAKGLYWPDLSVEGVYSRSENEPESTFGLDESIYGVLKLDFPFFEGGLRKAEVSQARARLKQAGYSLSELNSSVSLEVESAYLDLDAKAGILEKLRAEVEYAGENFNAVTKQFQYGLANSIDVIDANTLFVTAERKLANAQYDYYFAILKLKRAVGIPLRQKEIL